MIKARFVVAMISAIACFAVVAPPAHAGGGMGTGSGVTTCRVILNGGPNQGQTVKLTDSMPGTNPDQVKVGAAVLVCDLAAIGTLVAGSGLGAPPVPPDSADSVTCYTLSGADQVRILATMTDGFTEVSSPNGQPVQIGALQFMCVPSVIVPR